MVKDPKKVAQGKKNKVNGREFELRVRKDLESKGWIVDKWSNNVEFIQEIEEIPSWNKFNPQVYKNPLAKEGKIIPAKRKWAGPGRPMAIGTGFPDFSCHRWDGEERPYDKYEVIGVESKSNGYLDKEEKEKCKWLLNNNIFSKILIAEKTKIKNKIVIVYHDFEEKYEKK